MRKHSQPWAGGPGLGALGEPSYPLPRLHFLQAIASVEDVFTHQDLPYQVDSCSCELLFGQKRRKITVTFNQNKPGLDYKQYTHVLIEALTLIEQKLNRKVSKTEFNISQLHLSIDFFKLKLEGVQSITLSDLDGWLYRLYNKGDSLRSEMVLTDGRITLDQVHPLMLSRYHETRQQQEILKKLSELQNDIGQLKENGANNKQGSMSTRLLNRIEQLLKKCVNVFIPEEPSSTKPNGDFIQ